MGRMVMKQQLSSPYMNTPHAYEYVDIHVYGIYIDQYISSRMYILCKYVMLKEVFAKFLMSKNLFTQ